MSAYVLNTIMVSNCYPGYHTEDCARETHSSIGRSVYIQRSYSGWLRNISSQAGLRSSKNDGGTRKLPIYQKQAARFCTTLLRKSGLFHYIQPL